MVHILLLLMFLSPNVSASCEFRGKVNPKEFQEKVKNIYEDMCPWWVKTFPSKPLRGDITLNKVNFIKNWEGKGYPEELGELTDGLFWRMDKKDFNEIAVIHPLTKNDWKKDDRVMGSVIAHEIFHFFQKSCCFDAIKKIKDNRKHINNTLYEASAFWAQDQYLKRNYGVQLTDLIVIEDKDFFNDIENFDKIHISYAMLLSFPRRVRNSVLWFKKDPQKNLDDLFSGKYLVNPSFGVYPM